jgi:hypothetical protein
MDRTFFHGRGEDEVSHSHSQFAVIILLGYGSNCPNFP